MGRKKKYLTEEERLEARKEANKRFRENHTDYRENEYKKYKERILVYNKHYYQKHKEEYAEYNKLYFKQYYQTPMGRAHSLLSAYKQSDKKHNRGKCTLTAKWIVENIFAKNCKCGESDWTKLGCNRLDNSLPHTPDNVEPCCAECNKKLPKKYV